MATYDPKYEPLLEAIHDDLVKIYEDWFSVGSRKTDFLSAEQFVNKKVKEALGPQARGMLFRTNGGKKTQAQIIIENPIGTVVISKGIGKDRVCPSEFTYLGGELANRSPLPPKS